MAIQGKVNAAREPVVVLQTAPKKRKFFVIIDTGFSGELCLSPKIIEQMGFERIGREAYVLADGQIVHADIHKAEIIWFSHTRPVEVIALENPRGLLGTELLQDCSLTIHFKSRKMTIKQDRR
jgi:clan AA aspartic protease